MNVKARSHSIISSVTLPNRHAVNNTDELILQEFAKPFKSILNVHSLDFISS